MDFFDFFPSCLSVLSNFPKVTAVSCVMGGQQGGKLIYASLFTQNPQVLLADSGSHGHT